MSRRLLILTASTGAGHLSAAEALRQQAETEGWTVRSIDCMDCCSKGFSGWYRGGYEALVRKRPRLWGALYRASDQPRFAYFFQTALDWYFMGSLRRIIAEFQPDWVLCTHSLPQPRLASLRQRFGFKIAIVVTDLYPHRMWLRGKPDLVCVPTSWSLSALQERVGSTLRGVVTGIPIGSGFSSATEPEKGNELRVLLSAGGIGGGPMLEAAKSLAKLPFDFTIQVLCGWNKNLLEAVRSIPVESSVSIVATPSTPYSEMACIMRSSDVLVGKSGGLTTAESLAVGLPFVVFDPCLIPGQEEQNANFLVEVGAGVRAKTTAELADVVLRLLKDPNLREEMSRNAMAHATPNAAQAVLKLLGDKTVTIHTDSSLGTC